MHIGFGNVYFKYSVPIGRFDAIVLHGLRQVEGSRKFTGNPLGPVVLDPIGRLFKLSLATECQYPFIHFRFEVLSSHPRQLDANEVRILTFKNVHGRTPSSSGSTLLRPGADGRADYWCVGLTPEGKDGKLCSDITTNGWRVDMRMGLREANQSFSKAMKAVKQGKEVVLTERGKPIAVIKPLDPNEDQEAVIWRLEAEGILRPALKRGPMPKPTWKPIRVKGKLMSQTISEERDER